MTLISTSVLNMKILPTLAAALLFVTASSVAQPTITSGSKKCADFEWLAQSRTPAVGLAVINKDETCITVLGDLHSEKQAKNNAVFNVASLAKPIVTMLTLELVSQDKLALDEPLHQYYVDPDIADDPRHKLITPRLVLTHQVGFPNWRWENADKKLSFKFTPGEGHQYSGEGFVYLQKALEKKFGKSLELLASENIFQPAGMKYSTFLWQNVKSKENYAVPHNAEGNAIEVAHFATASAADNLYTTIGDYAQFIKFIFAFKNDHPNLFEQMISPQINFKPGHDFVLGWELLSGFENNERVLIHTGGDAGVAAITMLFPNSENAFVIFVNSENPSDAYSSLIPQMYMGEMIWGRK